MNRIRQRIREEESKTAGEWTDEEEKTKGVGKKSGKRIWKREADENKEQSRRKSRLHLEEKE